MGISASTRVGACVRSRASARIGVSALLMATLAAGCSGSGPGPDRAEPPSAPGGGGVPSSGQVAASAPTPTGSPIPRPVQTTDPPTPAFWGRPVVEDGFDGTSVDASKWIVYDSPNDRVNPRTAAATKEDAGTLQLTGGIYGGKDLSGGIASRLTQTHGRWEVRMRASKGAGYSAVALLWPKVFGDPEKAEIDFAEMIDPTKQSSDQYIHYGPNDTQKHNVLKADFTQWHVFALDWLPHRLTFWLDGQKVWDYQGDLTPERSQMGLALQNDQVCDRGPGFCRTRSTPQWVTMYVDWIKIYRAPG
ncbi:glycoside hydrolase family 16 protein [Actinomadura rupiterrae]|uniref:glycoside hydrolase family 16 protein n=1 Tax=Actinomadura rupiterrae TaxID=559627 RepID=UPI0020A5BF4F|nr:glycoside hydrolase family 16 protein [Actinomadura rupiterrae]MCP2336749.1 beta-glucanase (GH16 family) [Actinomadura rupiterrae]